MKKKSKAKAKRRLRDGVSCVPVTCIANGCTVMHLGPRFRYLCGHHAKASPRSITTWQTRWYLSVLEMGENETARRWLRKRDIIEPRKRGPKCDEGG